VCASVLLSSSENGYFSREDLRGGNICVKNLGTGAAPVAAAVVGLGFKYTKEALTWKEDGEE
jgi:hypothetical protein